MTYLFDIGKVLLDFDFAPALGELTGPSSNQEDFQTLMAKKDGFESGQIAKQDFIAEASQLLDFHGSAEAFCDAWNAIFTPIPGTWELVKELKAQGHRLILYSNTNCIHAPHITSHYSVFEHFDGAIFSHEVKAIKPAERFYLASIQLYDLIPEETIYIDDMPENIAAGKAFGFHSFQYDLHNHGDLLEWLKTIPASTSHS